MAAQHLIDTRNQLQKVIYVVLNDVLKLQVEKSAEAAGIDVLIIYPGEINSYLKKDKEGTKYVFILDEYYEMMINASMSPLNFNTLPGIFSVTSKNKCILSTGHYSKEFKQFLLRHI